MTSSAVNTLVMSVNSVSSRLILELPHDLVCILEIKVMF